MSNEVPYRVTSNKFTGKLECHNNATVFSKVCEILRTYRSNAWVQVRTLDGNIITVHRGTAMHHDERQVWATFGKGCSNTQCYTAERAKQVSDAVLNAMREAGFSTSGLEG